MKIHKILNEKFSDSMPKWLQNYFLQNSTHRNRFGGKSKGPSKYADDEYAGFRRAHARDLGRDKSGVALDIFDELQLDRDRVNVIQQPVPDSIKDPIFSDSTKLPIVHLKSQNDETLWIPGRTAKNEKFILDDGNVVALQYMTNKQYKQLAKDFCYIDLNDSSNFTQSIKAEREANKQGSIERDRGKGKVAEDPNNWNSRQYDKSGYRKIPAARKYADKLREYKATKLASKLDDARDKLVEVQDMLNKCIELQLERNTASNRSLSRDLSGAIRQATGDFQNARDYYVGALNNVDKLDNLDKNSWDYKDMRDNILSNIFDWLKYSDSSVQETRNQLQKFLPKVIDWDETDDSVFSNDDWSDFQ